MSPSRVTAEGTIVLPKKITLPVAIAAIALIVGQTFYIGYSYAVGLARLERVERGETPAIAEMRERLARIETHVSYIRAAIERAQR